MRQSRVGFYGLLLAVVALMLCGCEEGRPAPPAPIIGFERAESAEGGVHVIVYYRNHNSNQQESCFASLNNLEELRNYRRQAEFLLNQLDEAERRMQVHEQEPVEQPEALPQ